jgi:hypothetical protein
VGPADLLSDPGRPLVNATGNFRVERNRSKACLNTASVSECSESARGAAAAVSVLMHSFSPAGGGAVKLRFGIEVGPGAIDTWWRPG